MQKPQNEKLTLKMMVEERNKVNFIPIERYTCYDCCLWQSCEFAFDLYNTDGDCLMEK